MNACTNPQSPIALPLRANAARHSLVLDWKYQPFAKQKHADHAAFYAVDQSMSGTTTFDKVVYNLDSMHFHAPSEHTLQQIRETRFDGELHIVSKLPGTTSNCLVIGIWFQINDTIRLADVEAVGHDIENIDPMIFIRAVFDGQSSVPAYTYPGSLTTPVDARCCDGPVTWVIPTKPLAISKALFNALFPEQKPARPIQDSTGRQIEVFNWEKSW